MSAPKPLQLCPCTSTERSIAALAYAYPMARPIGNKRWVDRRKENSLAVYHSGSELIWRLNGATQWGDLMGRLNGDDLIEVTYWGDFTG